MKIMSFVKFICIMIFGIVMGIIISMIGLKLINDNKIKAIPIYEMNKDYGNYEFLPMYKMKGIEMRVEVRM